MFGKNSTIRKYKYKLRPALAKRYGGSATYTKGQVDKTVEALRLNDRYIQYAYLMYCDVNTFSTNKSSNESTQSMNDTISTATGFGILGPFFGSIFYGGGSDDGGGFGSSDGGGGGE
ncbi:hypothetical protein HWQ46_26850 [Shewanella sp. D64]|uniref:DUF6559 family protein n=1 Tax=unclassified Shewanella TaxID=196818 RepID=UPI0022BA6A2F|nr:MULTISPECIES: DUF6559 family protein [unclassified Shewanella]MEC4729127.1 hypothetical protein [Shewanella sp. D64]MEC4740954.1 hypothetical protein [Shewanella sp. E94]WBJ97070.1 hypothetical protein HWQ47_08170 [Shewanella sp. MTB7]